jgi:flagellar protein FlaJ
MLIKLFNNGYFRMVNTTDAIRYGALTIFIVIIILSYLLAPKATVGLIIMSRLFYIKLPSNYINVSFYVSSAALMLLITLIPEYRRWRINSIINGELPAFVRVIRDGISAGLTLTESVAVMSKYGTRTLARMISSRVGQGIIGPGELSNILMELSREFNNNNLALLSIVLNSALRSGVRATEVLDLTYRELDNVITNELDKVNSLRPYVALAYTITIVYVFLGSVVLSVLLPKLTLTAGSITGTLPTGVAQLSGVDTSVLLTLFVYSIVVQAFLIGMLIGRIVYRNIYVGLMHSSAMTIIAVATNYLLNIYTPYLLHV